VHPGGRVAGALVLAIMIAVAAVGPRLLGGYSVLRHRARLHLAMGFAGGALVGVALFETLPEAIELLSGGRWATAGVTVAALAGVAAFGALERTVFGHVHSEDVACSPRAGHIGAGGITVHAFLDGLAIGSSFQVSAELGLIVSVAVLLHAFSDGLNTVTIVLRHGLERRKALAWLGMDALAPVLGAAIGLFVVLPGVMLGALLAFFAGMFLYMGAGSLLPEAHRTERDRGLTWLAAAAGLGLALAAAQLG